MFVALIGLVVLVAVLRGIGVVRPALCIAVVAGLVSLALAWSLREALARRPARRRWGHR